MMLLKFILFQVALTISILGLGKFSIKLLKFTNLRQQNLIAAYEIILGLGCVSLCFGFSLILGDGSIYLFKLVVFLGFLYFIKETLNRRIVVPSLSFLFYRFSLFLGLLTGLFSAFVSRGFNPCDDQPAYLYFAQKIIINSNIEENYNIRRTQAFPFYSTLQALSIADFPAIALNAIDNFVVPLLLMYLLRKRGSKTNELWNFIVALLLIFSFPILGLMNSSPVLFPVLLIAATLIILGKVEFNRDGQAHIFLAVGIATGVLIATRTQFGLPLILLVLILAIMSGRHWIIVIIKFMIGAALSLGTWVLIQYLDTGTPLYPIFKGNGSTNFPYSASYDNRGLGSLIYDNFIGFWFTNWGIFSGILLVSLIILGYLFSNFPFLRLEHESVKQEKSQFSTNRISLLLGSFALTSLITYIFLGTQLHGFGPPMAYTRYWVANFFALGLATPIVLMEKWNQTSETLTIKFSSAYPVKNSKRVKRQDLILFQEALSKFKFKLDIICLLLLLPMLIIYLPNTGQVKNIISISNSVVFKSYSFNDFFNRENSPVRELTHERILQSIPLNSNVLVGVEYPSLLLRSDLQIQSLDIIGAAVNREVFPFNASYDSKLTWLKTQGFDYAVLTGSGSYSCLFGRSYWDRNIGAHNAFEIWTPVVLKYQMFIDELIKKNPAIAGTLDDGYLFRIKTLV